MVMLKNKPSWELRSESGHSVFKQFSVQSVYGIFWKPLSAENRARLHKIGHLNFLQLQYHTYKRMFTNSITRKYTPQILIDSFLVSILPILISFFSDSTKYYIFYTSVMMK